MFFVFLFRNITTYPDFEFRGAFEVPDDIELRLLLLFTMLIAYVMDCMIVDLQDLEQDS
jgi:hypothetical protein